MATSSLNDTQDFEQWLCKKLTSLDIDNDVYGPYITGILEDEDMGTLSETLQEILESMVENSSHVCEEVIKNWEKFQNKTGTVSETVPSKDKNIDDLLASHIGVTSTQHHVKPVDLEEAAERNLIKRSVMERYNNTQEEEENEEKSGSENKPKEDKKSTHHNTVDSALELFNNTNAEEISAAEKQERLKRKEESIKKKEADKHDRELQKIKKAERKDKEKKRTQKKEKTR